MARFCPSRVGLARVSAIAKRSLSGDEVSLSRRSPGGAPHLPRIRQRQKPQGDRRPVEPGRHSRSPQPPVDRRSMRRLAPASSTTSFMPGFSHGTGNASSRIPRQHARLAHLSRRRRDQGGGSASADACTMRFGRHTLPVLERLRISGYAGTGSGRSFSHGSEWWSICRFRCQSAAHPHTEAYPRDRLIAIKNGPQVRPRRVLPQSNKRGGRARKHPLPVENETHGLVLSDCQDLHFC